MFVSVITEQDIWEIYTLKSSLFGLVTDLAIENITEKFIQNLEGIIALMNKCIEKKPIDIRKYQNLNDRFHYTIIDMAGHERLKTICRSLDNQTKRINYEYYLSDKEHFLTSFKHHIKILEAIKNKNKKMAVKHTQDHILNGLKALTPETPAPTIIDSK